MLKMLMRFFVVMLAISSFCNCCPVCASGIDNKIHTSYMTGNDCYNDEGTIQVEGIMIHSTAEPGIAAGSWFNLWNKSFKAGEINREVCVHAFVDNNSICQYLPWDHKGWHCGGTANRTHIGIEICEPSGIKYNKNHSKIVSYNAKANRKYFNSAWDNTVQLCAMLCKRYRLNETNIISHQEGHKLGIASGHTDPEHWWKFHGKNMNDFRSAVRSVL